MPFTFKAKQLFNQTKKSEIMDRNSKVINQKKRNNICVQKGKKFERGFISVAGGEGQILSSGEDERFWGQTEAGPDSLRDGHPCTRWTPEPTPGPTPAWLTPSKLLSPAPAGKRVLILNGPYREAEALLEGIDEKSFSATLTLDSVSLPSEETPSSVCAFGDTSGVNKVSPSLLSGSAEGETGDRRL